MMRDEAKHFIVWESFAERVDNIARLLDAKGPLVKEQRGDKQATPWRVAGLLTLRWW